MAASWVCRRRLTRCPVPVHHGRVMIVAPMPAMSGRRILSYAVALWRDICRANGFSVGRRLQRPALQRTEMFSGPLLTLALG